MHKTSITIISNILLEPHCIPLVTKHFGESINVCFIPYGEHNEYSYKACLFDTDLIVVWLNFEELFPDVLNRIELKEVSKQQVIAEAVNLFERFFLDVTQNRNVHVLSFTFENSYKPSHFAIGYIYDNLIDQINIRITELFSGKITFMDFKHIIAEVGIANVYVSKDKYRWNAPYSKALVHAAINEIHKQYLIDKNITKKCLVLDCDNVLWGGILSEDGIENIKLGRSGFGRFYQDFQRFVLSLYSHGVILALCSKNDLPDVLTVFHEHSDMILKEEHIAYFQVNWNNKADNIKRIAKELNIGLDSIVFVDDSQYEIEMVKSVLPEVTTILFNRDMDYGQFSCFNLKNNISTSDIKKRNETYRTNKLRNDLMVQYTDHNEYIAALELKVEIQEAHPIEFNRISELTQRTNKCTNGKRYTVFEIKERVKSKAVKLYSVSVADRFSDLGLVGAIEVDCDTLTLFSLSCRALGREVEKRMIEFIFVKHQINNIVFESTGKNTNFKEILENGFPSISFFRGQ